MKNKVPNILFISSVEIAANCLTAAHITLPSHISLKKSNAIL